MSTRFASSLLKNQYRKFHAVSVKRPELSLEKVVNSKYVVPTDIKHALPFRCISLSSNVHRDIQFKPQSGYAVSVCQPAISGSKSLFRSSRDRFDGTKPPMAMTVNLIHSSVGHYTPGTDNSKMETSADNVSKSSKEGKSKVNMNIVTMHIVSSLGMVAGTAYMVHQGHLQLYPTNVTAESLKEFASRLEYAAHYQSLLVGWLLFNVNYVMYYRTTRGAINPLDTRTESRTQASKNILTNSMEQTLLAVVNQLAFISFADPSTTLKFIPAINVLLLIGRVTFFAGYPWHRLFGVMTTLGVQTSLAGYNLYKLGGFLNFF